MQGFGGEREGKISLRRTRHRYDNIKMAFQEVGCGSMDWIDLAQWRTLVNAVMNLRVT